MARRHQRKDVWVFFIVSFFLRMRYHRCNMHFIQMTTNSDNKKKSFKTNFLPNPLAIYDIYMFTITLRTRFSLSSLTLPAMPNASGMLSRPL